MGLESSSSVLFFFLFSLFLALAFHGEGRNLKVEKEESPFGFLKHLQGCHRGDKVKGLHHLKTYLEKFGYLHYHHNQTYAHGDDFDILLESAVKTYQQNYKLNVTGDLDAQTVSTMMKPRCGVADIISGTNWMMTRNKENRPSSFHEVSHYSFFQGNPRWPPSKSHLTYSFPTNFHPEAARSVDRAFSKWASTTHFTFSKIQEYNKADMKISFHRGDHGDGSPFDGPGGTLAHAFAPTNGRFHYDADERWSVGAVAGAFDLETVALHEIGHLLGLGHSSVAGAIMYPSIPAGSTKGLHGDDIQGIKALYGK